MARLLAFPRVSARSLQRTTAEPLSLAALSGRLVELKAAAAHASLSVAMQWVLQAQRQGELAAWLQSRTSTFYPPDAVAAGVDMAALPLVHLESARACARAAEQLLRSGAFALVVIDLSAFADAHKELSTAVQSRLLGLAQKHKSAVICLSQSKPDAPSLGSLVSLRLHTERGCKDGRFFVRSEVLKDKIAGPGAIQVQTFKPPPGLQQAALK